MSPQLSTASTFSVAAMAALCIGAGLGNTGYGPLALVLATFGL